VAALVREHGGEYVSAGKESHFRIAKSATVTMEGLVYCPHCGKASKVKLEKT